MILQLVRAEAAPSREGMPSSCDRGGSGWLLGRLPVLYESVGA